MRVLHRTSVSASATCSPLTRPTIVGYCRLITERRRLVPSYFILSATDGADASAGDDDGDNADGGDNSRDDAMRLLVPSFVVASKMRRQD